ncbi:DUF305 domain-containing protein [Zafaria sp. Z1313]|uniref:DUF305 domain-containing protein n=1 Tax=unclassified Zafaria TaxID=2828765 RepID=UPI002E75F751|nr:DUF305 domain-containing protein [Zafaria sp. J156]MEE1622304.1 DUF305 domain-containing protein [Zafaria sp. J156]
MPETPHDPARVPDAPSGPVLNRPLVAALAALVVAVGIGGWLLGTLVPASTSPDELSADAGFARDMQTHHNQAVQLSLIVRDTGLSEGVRSIAYDIATTQAQQSGQMYAWLELWGLPQTGDRPAMAWMEDLVVEGGSSHAAHGTSTEGTSTEGTSTHGPVSGAQAAAAHTNASMGMASAEDITRLEESTGSDADRLYLELMIRHHQGGVAMAQAALDRASDAHVLDLAAKMITAQESEIHAMNNLLADLG